MLYKNSIVHFTLHVKREFKEILVRELERPEASGGGGPMSASSESGIGNQIAAALDFVTYDDGNFYLSHSPLYFTYLSASI